MSQTNRNAPTTQPTPAQWAWLAGLFEGEGSIRLKGNSQAALVVAMIDRDVIETIETLVPSPGGVREWAKPKLGRSQVYAWSVSSRDTVSWVLEHMLPWLHGRRAAKAREALDRLKKNRGASTLWTHCVHGHAFSESNTYIMPRTGHRRCRACHEDEKRRRRAARRAAGERVT